MQFTVRMYMQACLTDPCGLQETNVWQFAPSGCTYHTPAIVQPHAVPSQPSTAVTYSIQIATNLPTPRWTVWLTVPAPGFEPGSDSWCSEA
jgi:hypothetical protein